MEEISDIDLDNLFRAAYIVSYSSPRPISAETVDAAIFKHIFGGSPTITKRNAMKLSKPIFVHSIKEAYPEIETVVGIDIICTPVSMRMKIAGPQHREIIALARYYNGRKLDWDIYGNILD